MNKLFSILTLSVCFLAMNACDLDELTGSNGDKQPVHIRYLMFKYAEIPAEMSTETAIALMRSERHSSLRAAAVDHAFPMLDSLTNPFSGAKTAVNRIIITPPGNSHNGAARVLGGQDADVHPFQAGVPSSLLFDAVNGGHAIGQIHTDGSFELRFNENELVTGGNSSQGDFMEFILDTHRQSSTYATGRFMFIARNLANRQDTRRWAVFDGQFALQHGN